MILSHRHAAVMARIDYRPLRSLTARELVSALVRDGFSFDRQHGSHQHYLHHDGRRITVTYKHPELPTAIDG